MFQSIIVKRMNNAQIPPLRLRALSRPRRHLRALRIRWHFYMFSAGIA